MNIFDPLITGSLSVSGSGEISGDLTVLGTINATISGTSSNAISASHAAMYLLTSSFEQFTGSYNTGSFSGSFSGDGSNLYNIPASGVTGLNLSQISDGAATASISAVDGFIVNTNAEFTGSVSITGSIILNGEPVGTGKLNDTEFYSYTSSVDPRIDSLETESGSIRNAFNSYTSSNDSTNTTQDGRLASLETASSSLQTSTSSLNSFTASIDTTIKNKLNTENVISGSVQVNITDTTGYSTLSSSIATITSNVEGRVSSLETESGSIRTDFNSYTSSNDSTNTTQNNRLNSLESATSSLQTSTSSLNSFTSSIDTTIKNKLNTDGVISGSVQVNISDTTGYSSFSSSISSSIGSLSGSVAITTNGLSSTITSLSASLTTIDDNHENRLDVIESRYATTGSNVFIGDQTITGSLYISQNLIVQGSSSLENITASAVSIGTNTIILNTDSPAIRYAGISVFDSGSTNVTSSLYYDSLTNNWKWEHNDVDTNDSSIVLFGPLGTGIDNAPTLVGNYVTKVEDDGHGHHITTSSIFDNGSIISLKNNTEVTGTFVVTGTIRSNTTTLVSGSSQIDHNSTTNYVANQHIDHTSVSISAGSGLSGGGTIAASRTITLDTGSAHFVDGARKTISISDTGGADGINLSYSESTGVISGTLVNSAITIAGTSTSLGGSISAATILSGTGVVSGSAQLTSTFVQKSGDTMTGALRFNEGGYGRIAFTDNYHGLILRGIPNNAAGDVTFGDYTTLVQHSGDFRFYRTNGSINELYFQVNATAAYHRGNQIWDTSDFTSTDVTNWGTAYSKRISSVSLSSSTLTVTLADSSTVTTSVPTFNQNTTGNASTATEVIRTIGAGSSANLVYSQIADNDYFRIHAGGSSNSGYVEIATSDDGTEPIYVRQYTGVFSSLTRTLTLLDGSGNTEMPGYLGVGQAPNGSYRIITAGDIYLNGNGNGWAEGTWKQRRGGSTFYDVLDTNSYSSYALPLAGGTLTGQLTVPATANGGDHGIKVGAIRGSSFGSQTGDYIMMYERVHIGYPTGWGAAAADAPSYGLGVWGNIHVSKSNATGGGIILADDGDIVDLNDAYCSMRFSSGVRIFSANRGGSAVITLGSNGTISTTSNATIGGTTTTAGLTSSGHVLPSTNGTLNLGSSSQRWNTVFTSDLSMSNGIGDYTIVEGEEDLFIYNNKTNKVFKFLLQEVDPSIAPAKKI